MDPDDPIQRSDPEPDDPRFDDDVEEARRDRQARTGFIALVVVGTAALLLLFFIFGGMTRA